MEPDAKIYVAGHQGLVGGAIGRRLQAAGFKNLVGRSLQELDLRDQAAVTDFFARERPEYVFLAAAKVGGILANDTYPADFIYDNLMIACNVISPAASMLTFSVLMRMAFPFPCVVRADTVSARSAPVA